VVVQVEPDLWGYLEQARATRLPRSFADRLIALRDRLAPDVLLAWHLSVWGTAEDRTYSKSSLEHMDRLAAVSAAFYESLTRASTSSSTTSPIATPAITSTSGATAAPGGDRPIPSATTVT
jgi:hypothetical protein